MTGPPPAGLRTLRPTEVLDASAELEQRLAGSDPPEEVLQAAASLIRSAVEAGARTWDPEERAALRRTIARWTAALHRSGSRVELPDLAPFSGHLPSLDTAEADAVIALARAGRPIVACRIESADLRALDAIPRVRIVDCVLVDCDLSGIVLPGARFLHTTFDGCDFAATELPGLVATSSIFSGGTLERVKASRGTFCGSRFDGVVMNEGDFTSASFAAAIFHEVKAVGSHFADALFDLATVESVQFDEAKISDVVFTGAVVQFSTFRGADLGLSIFSGADVRGSSFAGARIDGASFAKAVDASRAEFDADAAKHAAFSEADAAWLRSGGSPSH